MTQADSVRGAPRINSPLTSLPPALAKQEANRRKSLRKLRRLRSRARDEIRRLIDFLDQSDPYATTELEDDDDREGGGDEEPSLGSFDQVINQERSWKQRHGEVIAELDAEVDDADAEPSLAASEHYHPGNQSYWGSGNSGDDREEDAGDDREHDEAESGLGDEDGLREQCGY
jgi:hypothetical protein